VTDQRRALSQVRAVRSDSVKLHLRDERTNGRTNRRVHSFVCLFVRYVCQGRPSYGGNEPRCFI